MNKKISLGAAVAFMVVVAGITFCITMMVSLNHFNKMVLNVEAREEMYKKLSNVDHEVRQNYAGQIDEEHLSDNITKGYIKGLGDKYSSYLTKNEYEQLLAEQNGKRVSIGIIVDKNATGYLTVTKVFDDSPAAKGGLESEDIIISIDDNDIKTMNLENAQSLLKGAAGTKIKLVYRRNGVDTSLELVRKDVNIPYVESHLIEKNGYVKITEFNDKTFGQFKDAVENMIQEGAKAFIFDVRGNNSGSINAANDMLNMLLPSGELGTIIDKSGNKKSSGYSDKYSINLPMSVLINAETGCAAEYFSAVLKDFEKANIIGVSSLGKTAFQEIKPLTDGSAINLTVSHFLTSSGTDLSDVGIKPDYEVKLTSEQEEEFSKLTEETDPQLKKAIEVVNSKK